MESKPNSDERLYLEKVQLSGYKSIINTEITFNKGLNIIIGKNAVGKTNFLTFLFKVLNFSYDGLYRFKSSLCFRNGKIAVVNAESDIVKEAGTGHRPSIINNAKTQILLDGYELEDKNELKVDNRLQDEDITLKKIIIYHGLPKEMPFLQTPLSIEVDRNGYSLELLSILHNGALPFFIRSIATDILFSNYWHNEFEDIPVKQNLAEAFAKISNTIPYLKMTSSIEDVRLSDSYNIFSSSDMKRFTINNLFLEFKIEGDWHPFSNLSDGTQRLFYIVADVAWESEYLFLSSGAVQEGSINNNRLILIEEPELGIHPHQLHELMLFLKEQSQHKQIIITTHSPQVLDILDEDELDNIIIASHEKGKGTLLRHLDEAEISKAKKYMDGDYLSDYWRFSDLEKAKN